MVSPHEERAAPSYSATPVWRRPNLVPLFGIAVCAELGYAILNLSAMPLFLREEVGIGEGMIAVILTVFLLSEAVFKYTMGHWGDRHGRRPMLLLAPLISACTAILTIFTRPALAFVALRFADGLGAAMIWPNIFAAVGDSVPKEERAEASSALYMCWWIGIAVCFLMDGLVIRFAGFRAASFYLVAALFGMGALLAWRFVPRAVSPEGERLHEEEEHRLAKLTILWSVSKRIPGHMILSLVTFIGIGLPFTVLKLYAVDVLGLSDVGFGAILLPAAATMAVLSLPMGRAVEQVGRTRSVRLGLVVGAFGMWAVALTVSKVVLGIVGMVVGLGFLIAIPAWTALVSDVDEARRGTFLGAVQTAQGIGALVGALLGGFLYQHVAPKAPFFGTAAALTLAYALSYFVFRPKRRVATDPPPTE